jgi:hypothetical protein
VYKTPERWIAEENVPSYDVRKLVDLWTTLEAGGSGILYVKL